MQIIRVDRKGNQFTENIFTSFKEVMNYCLQDLEKTTPRGDDVMYVFKILDSDEFFGMCGTPKGEDSVLYTEISFG